MKVRILAVVLALCLLAGCVTVPTSGPVERHSPEQQQANPGVDIAPVPPAPGASPGLIVEGFLHAMATFQAGYPVAREFLTAEASGTWDPEAGVEVYADGYPPQVSPTGVVLTAPLIGSVDQRGVFTPASGQFHHDFGLVRDADGQWRISRPPRGLLVSQSLFGSTWVRADVVFWDATGRWLVPDPRFVQTGRGGLLSTARAVLAGPSPDVALAYRPAAKSELSVQAVTLSAAGVATVDVTGRGAPPDAEARRSLAAELVWSLTSLEGVSGVRIRDDGVAWDLGGEGPATTADFAAGAPLPATTSDLIITVAGGALRRSDFTEPNATPQPIPGTLTGLGPVAVRSDGQVLAAITGGGKRVQSLVLRDGAWHEELTGSNLVNLAWTRQGELWAVQDRGARLRMVREGREVTVNANGLPPGRIRAFVPAPDGVRVAVIVESQGQALLGVAALTRSETGVRVVGWRQLSGSVWSPDTQQALDVGWSGPATLLVLLSGTSVSRVVSVDSSGAVATDVGPNDSSVLTRLGVSVDQRAVLLGADGQTWRFVDEFTWEPWLTDIQFLAMA